MSTASPTEPSLGHGTQNALPAPEPQRALPPPSRKGGVIRTLLILLVVAAAVGATVWKIRSNTKEQATSNTKLAAAADRALPVATVAVVQKTMPIYLEALGTVTPYYSVTIKSRVDGQLNSVNVKEGQVVRKGQVIAQIDSRPYEAAVAQAEGQLVKDQATAKNAQAEAARYTALQQAGVVSKESEQSQVATAGVAVGSLQADQAAIQAAKVNVTYTRIVSPIDGVVGLRQVDPGNIVHASDASGLLLITQLQPITVIFTLPEDQLPEVLALVRGGKKLQVEAYDRSETTHLATGTVLTLDNSIDPTTGTDKVKAVFPNADGALFPNQFVNIRLILQERQNAIVIPAAALQTGTQGTFVYVVKPGRPPAGAGGRRRGAGGASGATGDGAAAAAPAPAATADATPAPAAGAGGGTRRAGGGAGGANAAPFYVVAQPVKVSLTEGLNVIIESGVKPGDQVVVDGQEKLLPFSRVTPRAQAPSGGGAAPNTGQSGAAFGPGTAGSSDAPDNPKKQGLEAGKGVPGHAGHSGKSGTGGGAAAPSAAPGDHPHRHPAGQSASATDKGQPQ